MFRYFAVHKKISEDQDLMCFDGYSPVSVISFPVLA